MKKLVIKYEMIVESDVDMEDYDNINDAIKNGDIKLSMGNVSISPDDGDEESIDELARARVMKQLMESL